jgi:hypothetical protein
MKRKENSRKKHFEAPLISQIDNSFQKFGYFEMKKG